MIVSDIIAEVAQQFKVHKRDLIGANKFGFVIPARFALYKVLRERGMSLPNIGKWCGGRDHTTIRHGIVRAEYMMDKDHAYKSFIDYMINRQTVLLVPEKDDNDDQHIHHID